MYTYSRTHLKLYTLPRVPYMGIVGISTHIYLPVVRARIYICAHGLFKRPPFARCPGPGSISLRCICNISHVAQAPVRLPACIDCDFFFHLTRTSHSIYSRLHCAHERVSENRCHPAMEKARLAQSFHACAKELIHCMCYYTVQYHARGGYGRRIEPILPRVRRGCCCSCCCAKNQLGLHARSARTTWKTFVSSSSSFLSLSLLGDTRATCSGACISSHSSTLYCICNYV